MPYVLDFTDNAKLRFLTLENDPSKTKVLKAVKKALGLMETNLKHPSLNTHEFKKLTGPNGEKVFTAYAQQKTPAAYRILWHYGPKKNMITVITIVPHY